tara:strand:- start:4643 stop:4795 length:153 start_codon:yes stop_codon:yes gene_type:complete
MDKSIKNLTDQELVLRVLESKYIDRMDPMLVEMAKRFALRENLVPTGMTL